jgi:hypothetical protein
MTGLVFRSSHPDPKVTQLTVVETSLSAMPGIEHAQSGSGIVAQCLETVGITPDRIRFRRQIPNPAVDLIHPVRTGVLLHIRNHRGEGMSGPVVAELEPLNAACCAGDGDYIFTLVSVRPFRRREALAFDRKECVEPAVSPAFDYESDSARFGCEINLSSTTCFISGLSPELNVTPDGRKIGGAVKVLAQLLGQGCFRVCD